MSVKIIGVAVRRKLTEEEEEMLEEWKQNEQAERDEIEEYWGR